MQNYKLSLSDYQQILKLLKGKEVTIHAGIGSQLLVAYNFQSNLNYELEDKMLTIFNGVCLDFSDFEINIPNTNQIVTMTLDHNVDDENNLQSMELCVQTNNGYYITIIEYCGDYITKVNNKWTYKKVENITFVDGYEFFKHIPILQDLFVKSK